MPVELPGFSPGLIRGVPPERTVSELAMKCKVNDRWSLER